MCGHDAAGVTWRSWLPPGRVTGVPSSEFPGNGVHEDHRVGSLRACGPVVDGQPEGYWGYFRLDGTRMRSGFLTAGEPVGAWATYAS
jgi:hypothetical protein